MSVPTSKILDAYKAMYNKSITKTITEAEDTKAEDTKAEDDVEDDKDDEKSAKPVKADPKAKLTIDTSKNVAEAKKSGRATKPGFYSDFTGKIRTGGISGEVKDATFEIDINGHVEFKSGIWLDGTWSDRYSYWFNGTWKDGVWKAGVWYDGVWENGRHENGVFQGGVWKNGTWEYGVFDSEFISKAQREAGKKPTTWEDGVWRDGDWSKNAKWVKGRDKKGEEHTDAPFNWGDMHYTKYNKAPAKNSDNPRYSEVFTKSDDPRTMDTFDDEADKNLLAAAIRKGSEKVDTSESVEISECVKRHLRGTKILGSMIINEEGYNRKQEEALNKIRDMIVDTDKNTTTSEDKIESSDAGNNSDDSNDKKYITKKDNNLPKEKIDEAKKKQTKEEAKKLELNDEICMSLEDASVEDLEAVKQFINDGFKCLTDEEREDLANAEHEAGETPEEEAKERTTGVEDEDEDKTK